jgi:hypothetical protein
VIGADVHRVPLRHFAIRKGDGVGGELQAGLGREDVGAAREVFLDDVVLRGAGELGALGALALGGGDIEREQPRRRRVDRHRGVHPRQRNAGEECRHVAQMPDGDADLADLAHGERMIGIVARLRRQIEGDREPGLPLGEVPAVERVRGRGGGVAAIGADQPGNLARHDGASTN